MTQRAVAADGTVTPSPTPLTPSPGQTVTDKGNAIFTIGVFILLGAGWVAAMVWLVLGRRRGAREATGKPNHRSPSSRALDDRT